MIYYEEYGNPNNPTVMFLHGANFPHSFLKEYVIQDKYHLVIPHLYGYGKEVGIPYSTERTVDALCELAGFFGKPVTPIGFSLGAQLAVYLVSMYPDLFYGGMFISAWMIKNPKTVNSVTSKMLTSMPVLKRKWVAKIQGCCTGLTDKKAIEEFTKWVSLVSKETLINTVDNGIELEDFADRFSAIDVPTVAICGSHEYKDIRTVSISRMSALNSKCTAEIWYGASHNIPMAYSQKLSERIREYMELILNENRTSGDIHEKSGETALVL